MIYHDNKVYFNIRNDNVKLCEDENGSYGYFRMKEYYISKGQDPDENISYRDYPIDSEGTIKFKVGRHNTSEVADFWNTAVGYDQKSTYKKPIDKANFMFYGDLVLNMVGGIFGNKLCKCTIHNVVLMQYGLNSNNIWNIGNMYDKSSGYSKVTAEVDAEDEQIDVIFIKPEGYNICNYEFMTTFVYREVDKYTPAYYIRFDSKGGLPIINGDKWSFQLDGEFGRFRHEGVSLGKSNHRGVWKVFRFGLGKNKKVLDIGRVFRITIQVGSLSRRESFGIDKLSIDYQLFKLNDGAVKPCDSDCETSNWDYAEGDYHAVRDPREFVNLTSEFYVNDRVKAKSVNSYTAALKDWAYRDVVYEINDEIVDLEYVVDRNFIGDSVNVNFRCEAGLVYKDMKTKQNTNGFIRKICSNKPLSEKEKAFDELDDCVSYEPFLEYVFGDDFGIKELDDMRNMEEGKTVIIDRDEKVVKPNRLPYYYIAKIKIKKAKIFVACGDVAIKYEGVYDVEYVGFKKKEEW